MLEARDISFSYGRRKVLDGVSFSVSRGETVAVVGANGAGKTTLLEILAGVRMPTAGEVRAEDVDAFARPIRFRRSMGFLSEAAWTAPDLTVKEYLKFRALLKGEQRRKIRHRVLEAAEQCGLRDVLDARTGSLSAGRRKCVAIAEAIMLRPRFLVLDDMFAGLDPAMRERMVAMFSAPNFYASAVVSGHELDDFGRFAKRFVVIRDGGAVEVSTVAEAREAMA